MTSTRHPEYQYLDLIKKILEEGNDKDDRTGTGTLSVFGHQMRFPLSGGQIPLLTTKRLYWWGIVKELLWFISGQTDANILKRKQCHFWDDNSTREFLDQRGLSHYEEGDLGPVYGFQWRHWGAAYKTCHDDYSGQGIDQLANVISQLKTDPSSRRIVLSAWNPGDLDKMALPPCHILAQFYVHDYKLSCQVYQRSADVGLGVPFNIASYALLTHLLAHICDLIPHELVYTTGDTHIYKNHIEALKTQLTRAPLPLPTLRLNPCIRGIEFFTYESITLLGYQSYPGIYMKMAV